MEIDSKWIGNGSRLKTLAPLTGVIIVVLVVIGFVLTGGSGGIYWCNRGASLRAKTFPDWFGWTSVLMAIGLVTPINWLIEGLSLIWIALVSIWLFARSG
jgi:hypothetical protein